MSDIRNITVTTKQLAEIFNVSEGYISDLVTDYSMPKVAFNQFNLLDCLKFRFAHLEKIYQDKLKRHDDDTSKGRIEAATAKLKEIEVAEKEKQLGPVAEFEFAFRNQIQIYKKGIDALSSFCKFDLHLTEDQLQQFNDATNKLLIQSSEIPAQMLAKDVNFNLS